MRRLGLVGFVCLITLAGLTAVGAPAQAFSVICTGKTKTQVAKCDTSGYAAVMDKMHWRMYGGHNCTNYAAYRMQRAGVPEPRILMGNARDWHTNAKKLGYAVDSRPAVGAIAQWSKAASHVAYVEEVGSGYLVLSEDSYTSKTYRRYKVNTGASWYPERFIHFKDVASPDAAPTPPPAQPAKARATVTVTGPAKVSTRIAPTVTVKVATSDGAVPSGQLRIRRGGVTVKSVYLTAAKRGTATVAIPRMKLGKQWISAVFEGSSTVLAGTSPTIKVTVTKPPKVVSSTTTVSPPATLDHGQRPTVPVVVKSADGRSMTNKVSVYVDGKLVAAPKVTARNKGRVSVRLPALLPGSHTIRATYWGSKPVKRSLSKTARFTVVEPTSVTATVPAPTVRMTEASVRATVSTPRGVAPTAGRVDVLVDGVKAASATLTAANRGTVTIPLTGLEPGTRRIAVAYAGTAAQKPSTGPEQTVTVTEGTVTGLAVPASVKSSARARITVSVLTSRKAPVTTGSVRILDGSKVVATRALTAADNGKVVIELPRLAAGTHQLTASFGGAGVLEPSASVVRALKVTS
ncbi:Ig-like domain repeat protein [Aeromicrobium sp. 179-A 4D2 NHS]|uniref:Ig-like domain repeat protein n=1 Tax=Aeromicrobium sp. 179-A 4D2 NHS TaxID=3142375 RepID=UPI0039A23E33